MLYRPYCISPMQFFLGKSYASQLVIFSLHFTSQLGDKHMKSLFWFILYIRVLALFLWFFKIPWLLVLQVVRMAAHSMRLPGTPRMGADGSDTVPEINNFLLFFIGEIACVVLLSFFYVFFDPSLTHPAYDHFLHGCHICYHNCHISIRKCIPERWNGSTHERKDPQKWALRSLLTQRCGRKRYSIQYTMY